jgi:hypothetical protein
VRVFFFVLFYVQFTFVDHASLMPGCASRVSGAFMQHYAISNAVASLIRWCYFPAAAFCPLTSPLNDS